MKINIVLQDKINDKGYCTIDKDRWQPTWTYAVMTYNIRSL
jgi:hypothetical protein